MSGPDVRLRTTLRVPSLARFCFAVLGYSAAIVAGIWLVVRAAGTVYALPVFFLICFAFYLHDTALKIVERRRRRASRAARFADFYVSGYSQPRKDRAA